MIDQVLVVIGVTFLVMISPGPDMVIVTRNTLMMGRRSGLLTSLGVLTGNLVHITYCVIGIGWLISQSILAFSILKYLGAAYLIYLGYMSYRTKPVPLNQITIISKSSDRTAFIQGFLNNILNPKGTLFYLGVFTVIISPQSSWFEMLILVIIMKLVSASFWLVFVVTLDRQFVRSFFDRAQMAINRVFGTLLIALGIKVALLER